MLYTFSCFRITKRLIQMFTASDLKLEEAIKEKMPSVTNRKGIVFYLDNATPLMGNY